MEQTWNISDQSNTVFLHATLNLTGSKKKAAFENDERPFDRWNGWHVKTGSTTYYHWGKDLFTRELHQPQKMMQRLCCIVTSGVAHMAQPFATTSQLKACLHGKIVTAIYSSQLMGYMGLGVIVAIALFEHLNWIPHSPLLAIKKSQSQSHRMNRLELIPNANFLSMTQLSCERVFKRDVVNTRVKGQVQR